MVITMAKLRMAHASTHGARMAHASHLGQLENMNYLEEMSEDTRAGGNMNYYEEDSSQDWAWKSMNDSEEDSFKSKTNRKHIANSLADSELPDNNTPGTVDGPGGRDRTLAVKS